MPQAASVERQVLLCDANHVLSYKMCVLSYKMCVLYTKIRRYVTRKYVERKLYYQDAHMLALLPKACCLVLLAFAPITLISHHFDSCPSTSYQVRGPFGVGAYPVFIAHLYLSHCSPTITNTTRPRHGASQIRGDYADLHNTHTCTDSSRSALHCALHLIHEESIDDSF